jgi:hypothetical protein
LGVISYIFLMVNEKQMKIIGEIDRNRSLKQRANEGRKGASILTERARENIQQGRGLF